VAARRTGDETAYELGARVFAGFRDHMWPILGRTTVDARAVIDRAVEKSAVEESAVGDARPPRP